MNRLNDKTAVITGAAGGIGRAIAFRMAEQGARVALLDIAIAKGADLADEINDRGGQACFWRCDVSCETEVGETLREASERFGGIGILVNNAGVLGVDRPTHEVSEAEWDAVQAVNVKGVFFAVKHAVAHMRESGGGSIINVSSIHSGADLSPYRAGEGAVRLMSRSDALAYAPDGIRVNSIHCSSVRTPAADNPLGRMGEPDDVAWGAVYLASNEARFVTGTELVIDGGRTAR